MTGPGDRIEDDVALAAEVALRLLDPAAMAAAERRMSEDRAFRDAVRQWEEHFATLADELPAVAPPGRVWAGIKAEAFGAPRKPAGSILGWLRGLAIGAVAAAAVAVVAHFAMPPVPPGLVAEIAAEDRSLVIAANLRGDQLTIARAAGGAAPGRVLELWAIGGDGVPVSLGVLPEAPQATLALAAPLRARLAAGVVLAISDEPPGGSPTGAPTGAVLATGQITDL